MMSIIIVIIIVNRRGQAECGDHAHGREDSRHMTCVPRRAHAHARLELGASARSALVCQVHRPCSYAQSPY